MINHQIIPEQVLTYLGGKYKHYLEIGETFKSANLTPVYLHNVVTDQIFVTSEEKINGNYH
jgi:hypothetical protein